MTDLTERQEHALLMTWVRQRPLIANNIFHVANERKCSPFAGMYLKNMGVKAGVPDFILPIPNAKYHGLFIELKRKRGYKISPEQQLFIDRVNLFGYLGEFAYGAEHAIEILSSYLDAYDMFQDKRTPRF